ncbi:TPA: MmcQ/YjbR family DNA-binding protein [Neisseria polysaccharea]
MVCLNREDCQKPFGFAGDGGVTSINVKSNPDMVSVLRQGENFLPAYHMNKQHWVGIVLGYGAETDEILTLLDWSYDLMGK